MLKKIFFFFFFFILLNFSFLFKIENTQAQGTGIKISPVKIDPILDAGQIHKGELKVANESSEKRIFYVYIKDFKAGDEEGTAKVVEPGSEGGYSLASWIDITQEGIDFAPGEEKVIPFSINVPSDAGPGGYYGSIFFGTKPPRLSLDSKENGAGMSVAQQAGFLILLRVKGEVLEEALIRDFVTDKKVYNTPFDVVFNTRIENKGNVHIKPYGIIIIKDMFDREKAKIEVNDKSGYVLPKEFRKFSSTWSSKYGFGKYTAEVGLTYGEAVDKGGQGKKSLSSITTFWIIPWKIVTPFLVGIGVLSILFIFIIKFYKDRVIKNAMKKAGINAPARGSKENVVNNLIHSLLVLLIILVIIFLLIIGIYFIFFA